jgi:hypothetical protein
VTHFDDTCSDSLPPWVNTIEGNFDSFLLPCTLPAYYVQTGGSTSASSCPYDSPCGTLSLALSLFDMLGSFVILGTEFSGSALSISSLHSVSIYTSPGNLPSLATLSYSSTGSQSPFFTIDGDVDFSVLNLTILFNSNNKGVFVYVIGNFINIFNF